jgi:hypothetical protein
MRFPHSISSASSPRLSAILTPASFYLFCIFIQFVKPRRASTLFFLSKELLIKEGDIGMSSIDPHIEGTRQ